MNSKLIRNSINNTFNIKIQDKTRRRDVVYPRAIYYKLASDFSGESLASIGRTVNKDHATVIHGLKLFNNVINSKWEKNYYNKYLKLKSHIENKLNLQIKRIDPDRFYHDKYKIKLLQNREMYNFAKDLIFKMYLMDHKFTDKLRAQLDNIADDKRYKDDN